MIRNQLSSLRVLIADDEKMIRRLVLDVLNSLGFTDVTVAHSGRQAIEFSSKQKFDFIITDWCMADIDGIELVRYMRNSPESLYPTTPIIMLTGNTEAHYVITALNVGINGYLIKPFSAEQLVKRIRNIIEQPRPFILSPNYKGPDRRRGDKAPLDGVERRAKPKNRTGVQGD